MIKRGMSPVVATILLVLLTVSAVAIIAGYLVPFVKNSLESTSCTKYRDYFSFYDSGYNCYDASSKLQGFSIEAKSDEELGNNVVGFNVFISKEGFAKSIEINSETACGTGAESIRMFNDSLCANIKIPGSGEVRSYVYNTGGDVYTRLRVAPILNINGQKKVCDASDEIQVSNCNGDLQ